MSESRYWQMVNRLVAKGNDDAQTKSEIREEIVTQVHAAYAEGQHWATETLMRWERDGADDDYTKVHKNLNTVTYIRADGRRVRKTASYSRPARADDSGEIVGMQMQTWWGMDRAGLFELRTEIAGQAARLDDVIHAIDQLIGAMDQHPTCKTAREAWEAAGHSVDEIELGEVAS